LSRVEEILREKLPPEDYALASELLNLPISKIRDFIQEKAIEAEEG